MIKEGILRVIDFGADDIRGQHVRRELDALEIHLDGGGQAFDRQGLGKSRNALKQDMAPGQQADQQAFDQMMLAYDYLGHLLPQQAQPGRTYLDRLVDGLYGRENISFPLFCGSGGPG